MSASRISDLLPVQNLGDGATRQGLHDYQWEAVVRIQRTRRLILADQPGLGKTFEILVALEQSGLLERPGAISLVLAPKIVAQIGWKKEIERFVRPAYPNLRIVYAFDGTTAAREHAVRTALAIAGRSDPRAGDEWAEADLLGNGPILIIANHNAIDFKPGQPIKIPSLLAPLYDAIIVDEAHLVLPTRVNADAADRTRFWHGLSVLRHHPLQLRIPVSGTMYRGKLENLLGYKRFMYPHLPEFHSFWGWVAKNFRTYKKVVNRRGTTVTMIEQKPINPLEWLNWQKANVLRRTKQEVLPQLPPKQYHNIELDLTPAMKKAYDDYEANLELEVEARAAAGLLESASNVAMKMYLRGRQLATCIWDYTTTVGGGSRSEHGVPLTVAEGEAPKLDWIVEFLEERQETGAKVVIASGFTQILEWLERHLTDRLPWLDVALLTGETVTTRRSDIEESFQRGSLQVVLLSQTIGVGITLDAADDLILVDVPKDPDTVEQVEDRVHRAGSFHQVNIWRLISIGTLDVDVVKAQDATYKKLRDLTDAARGVDNARVMLNKVTARSTRQRGKEAARG